MGFSISWLAVKGLDKVGILDRLGLKSTGNSGDFFDYAICGQGLKNGWYLVVTENCDHPFQSEKTLARLSAGCEMLACSIEEHVMFSRASYWKDGSNLWQIDHQGDGARENLNIKGEVPEAFEAIRKEYAAKQISDREVDWYFEMPLELAKQMTGFKHDEIAPEIDGRFEEMSGLGGESRKPWWKVW